MDDSTIYRVEVKHAPNTTDKLGWDVVGLSCGIYEGTISDIMKWMVEDQSKYKDCEKVYVRTSRVGWVDYGI